MSEQQQQAPRRRVEVRLMRGSLKLDLILQGGQMIANLHNKNMNQVVFAGADLKSCHLDRYEDWSRTLWIGSTAFELLTDKEWDRVTAAFAPLGLKLPKPKAEIPLAEIRPDPANPRDPAQPTATP